MTPLTLQKSGINLIKKEQLQAEFGIKTRQWQRWCVGLGFSASLESYSDEQIKQLRQLKQLLNERQTFEDAIAQITGNPKQSSGGMGSALAGRYSKEINQLAPGIAEAMVEALDSAVLQNFEQKLKTTKPRIFEQFAANFSLAISGDDIMDAMLLEGGEDED
jgi:hypothetical protein